MSAQTATAAPATGRPPTRDSKKTTSTAKTHSENRKHEQNARKQGVGNSMNQEQLRIAALVNEKSDSSDIAKKVAKVIELTKASKDAAVVALHDCDYDLNRAVSKILEGDSDDNWTSVSSKSKKEKEKAPLSKVHGNETTSVKQSNGTSNKTTTSTATANRRNKAMVATDTRKSGDRPDKLPKSRGESNAQGSAFGSEKDRQVDGKTRGPRAARPVRDGFKRSERQGDRRPEGIRRPERSERPNRQRGPRTFSNQQKSTPLSGAADDFPNSIDTWSNTTADPNARPTPAPITSMTVGNWSDVVSGANEDLSEEDYGESSLMETKVFVPSGNSLPVKNEHQPVVSQATHVQKTAQHQLDRKEAAGAQILQSLKQPVSQSGYSQINQSYINKQAANSIKSLVGIPTAAYPATSPASVPAPHREIDPKPVSTAPAARPVNQSRRTATRIPESAVEMPSYESVASLRVHFGALDVNFSDQPYGKSDPMQPLNHKNVMTGGTSFEQQAKSVLNDDMMKRHDVLSAKSSETMIDPRNAVAKHVKSSIDSVKGTDLYSVSGSQHDFKGNVPYGTGSKYSAYSGISSTTGQFNVYTNPSTYAPSSYSNYQSPAHAKNMSSNLKDSENSVPQKHSSYDMQSPAGLVNSTQTTNVLKNSLPATGKGSMGNTNAVPRVMPPMVHPPYIMGGVPSFYPLPYDPNLQMPQTATQDATAYATAYNQSSDTSKFVRPDGVSDGTSSGSSGVSSQAPQVSQHSQQQFIVSPGYVYYMQPAPGIFPPQGSTFVPVSPVSSAHVPAAPGFPKVNYSSHSYDGTGYDATGIPMPTDYGKAQSYGQNPNQQKQIPSNDLMGQSSSYNKLHGVPKSYDKMSYPSVGPMASAPGYNLTGSQASLGASYGSYMVPPNMSQAFAESAPSQSGVGRTLPAGTKGPVSSASKSHGQAYQNPGGW